ncbi:DUF6415 family natural product biosynthesis protein [Streptomyces sp. NPDC048002]|uniref:DUF6415 family natural product biosynthesis protein n=1 Tax=Streptomyces sp. NPDC048002 TaxID=3154344 RepID=UPI0033E41972
MDSLVPKTTRPGDPPPTAERTTQRVDVSAARKTVSAVLPPDTTPADPATLAEITATLRGHMQRLIPAVEQAARQQPPDDVPRLVALVCVREARGKLGARPGLLPGDPAAYARRLGRSLLALCDHYDALTGVRACLACDQPIRDGEDSQPYSQDSASGGAITPGRIHARCANTVRVH